MSRTSDQHYTAPHEYPASSTKEGLLSNPFVAYALWFAGIFLGVLLMVLLFKSPVQSPANSDACPIFCTSELLRQVQHAHLFNSSKTFVDMPMRADPATILAEFENLLDRTRSQQGLADGEEVRVPVDDLRQFVSDHFSIEGSDLTEWLPEDFKEKPDFLPSILNEDYRKFAEEVHSLWLVLGKKMKPEVFQNPLRYSLIPTRNELVVPGDRFREVYYWDSYWVVKGLLVSGMAQTAKKVVDNLIGLVETFGFVPNGARRYYLNRSQPPFLGVMVAEVYANQVETELGLVVPPSPSSSPLPRVKRVLGALGPAPAKHENLAALYKSAGSAKERLKLVRSRLGLHSTSLLSSTSRRSAARSLLKSSLATLEKEYYWWMLEGKHRVSFEGGKHILNRYFTDVDYPRPESFREDEETYQKSGRSDKEALWSDIAAAAESGWDFSGRWFRDKASLSTVATRSWIPVDLNTVMCHNERMLAALHAELENDIKAVEYAQAWESRVDAMEALLWRPELNQWADKDLEKGEVRTGHISNFMPLWGSCYRQGLNTTAVIEALRSSGLELLGGLVTTLHRTSEQWDYPNAWPPLQELIIRGLEETGTPEGRAYARHLAEVWVASNYLAFEKTGYMYEKLDATELGKPGGGGEYAVQIGFGWTNGVVLDLLHSYPDLVPPPRPAGFVKATPAHRARFEIALQRQMEQEAAEAALE